MNHVLYCDFSNHSDCLFVLLHLDKASFLYEPCPYVMLVVVLTVYNHYVSVRYKLQVISVATHMYIFLYKTGSHFSCSYLPSSNMIQVDILAFYMYHLLI